MGKRDQKAAIEKKLASLSPEDRAEAEKAIKEGKESIYIDTKEGRESIYIDTKEWE